MCGRFVLTTPPNAVKATFGYAESPNFPPRYNIAPTQPIAVVRQGEGGAPQFALMRWGFLPSWVKDPRDFPLLINARSEEAAGKPAFRAAMRRRRCLVPADGFYEWQKAPNGKKQPFFIRPRAAQPIAFAGLWETYVDTEGGEIDTVAILTVAANEKLASLHHRMPVVIAPADFARWLDAARFDPAAIADLLVPAENDVFDAYPVSTRVNRVANDDPGLLEPLADDATPPPEEKPKKSGRRREDDDQMTLF